ncbi:hypothetical protein [Fluviibacter phosphoraccumulans]|uniref:hypothetical protein n=1 Tax=Fluviibacter phosphoraccumulans TaxID=1751046 RepID=UPI0010AF5341|nr:hypothetical protein [Fluviibacter phosphoraccumulans]BCA64589.1 hypothetical protein SHINM1_001910 [Fluviibacter phosphoraccumulans]
MTDLEIAKNRLYGASGIGAQNLKLYPGTNRDIGVEELSNEINQLISLVEAGDFEDIDYSDSQLRHTE